MQEQWFVLRSIYGVLSAGAIRLTCLLSSEIASHPMSN